MSEAVRTGPSMYEYLNEANLVKYDAFDFSPERIESIKYIQAKVIEFVKYLVTLNKERREEERLRKLNNKGKGYYINAKFYAPAIR